MIYSSNSLPFLIAAAKKFRWILCGQILIGICFAIDLSLSPYILKMILDRIPCIASENAIALLWGPATFYVFMSAVSVFMYRLYDWLAFKLVAPLKKYIGIKLMKRMMDHSHHLYQNNFSGSLANKINDVISSVPKLFKIFIEQFFSHTIALMFAVYTQSRVSSKFALALIVWVLIFLIGTLIMSKKAKDLSGTAAEGRSHAAGHIVDILSNMMNVRLFASKKYEVLHLQEVFQESVTSEQTRDWFFMKMYVFQGGSFIIFQSLCLWWLVVGIAQGEISTGDFVLIVTLNISIVSFLWNLSKDIREFAELLGNITQGLALIQSPIELCDAPNATKLVVSKGEIVFDSVQFYYQDAEPLFENKSVTILPGQKVGLVGRSGGGKSTFTGLILRLFDVTSGRILIDGQDIRTVTQDSLHQAIGLIPQDPSLFNRTLMENIRYGRMGASDAEVIEAARRAHAHEFIVDLPKGYETLVGERGTKLSGGQRQRIAIAQAILKNPLILILDEVTSQLDPVTEQHIQESLWELMEGKTSIVIAHRLSTVLHMDRIMVLDGKIVQDGTHEELLQQEGPYRLLWEAQSGGVLPADNYPSIP